MKYKITNIDYGVDFEDVADEISVGALNDYDNEDLEYLVNSKIREVKKGLPKELVIDVSDEDIEDGYDEDELIADEISNQTGFLVNSFYYEPIDSIEESKSTLTEEDEEFEENENSYSEEEIRDAVGKATDHTFDFDYVDLLCDLVERAIDGNGDVSRAIDEGMTYYKDQWTAYMYFCDPGDDIDIMLEGLYDDVSNTLYILGFNSEEG